MVQEAVMARGYDKLSLNYGMVLGLPFREGSGTITHDVAPPNHLLTLNDPGGGSFTWGNLAMGCPYLQFTAVGGAPGDGVYLDCPAADTGDLDFTTGDYSIGGWINWQWNGWSSVLIARYELTVGAGPNNGWETYFDESGGRNTLTLRHNHETLAPNRNSSCYSEDWTPGEWWFLGISRRGNNLYPLHYRNAITLEMSYEASGMLDPDTCNADLVLGCRWTKDANWYLGMMWNKRVWAGRALAQEDWELAFEMERKLFGV